MTDPNQLPDTAKRWGRGRTMLLYASLALNLIVAGIIVGAVLFGGRPGPRAVVDGPVPLLRALSDTERDAFVQYVRADSGVEPRERPVMSMRRSREILSILRAPEFDADQFDSVIQQQIRAASERITASRSALIRVLSNMTLEERKAYSDRLEKALQRPFRDRPPPASNNGSQR